MRGLPIALVVIALAACSASVAEEHTARSEAGETAVTDLERGFTDPPLQARTRCYWWWLNGNVTQEAITRDLEEMKAKGFGGGMIFDADGSNQRGNDGVPAGPMFGSAAWRQLLRHAMQEADRLGLELSLSIQSGWNLGGPDVTPNRAAKQLTWSETRIEGSKKIDVVLPIPPHRAGFYKDVAVLAYRLKASAVPENAPTITASSWEPDHPPSRAIDGDTASFYVSAGDKPGDGPSEKRPEWLQLEFVKPVTVASTEVLGRPRYDPRMCELQVARDGRGFKRVRRFRVRPERLAQTRFTPVEGRVFRLLLLGAYDPRSPKAPRNVQVAEWWLLGPDGQAVEGMFLRRPIRVLRLKAAFHELGGSAPDCRYLLDDLPAAPNEEDVRVGDVVNLTPRVDATGRLRWQAPKGTWAVLRFGYAPTSAHVSTASGDWTGMVIDYLSTPALRTYWDRHVRPLLDDVGPRAGKVVKYLHTDSYECRGMNWTPGFEQEFRKHRGYDPIAYLPVIAGKIVESRAASNRFLADFRKTIGDCIAENHYTIFANLSHQAGLEVHPESGGPHAGPFDALKCLGRSDVPMSEFWVPSPHRPRPENRFFVKQAASAAHIYGKRLVAAEGFTSIGPHWDDVLWQAAKPSFDHEACDGLNLTFIHTFTCSPRKMGLPGQEYFAGTHFNPNVTWWNKVGPFIAYLNRCQYILQQGQFVADVLYYYGDHVPNLAQRKEVDPAGALPGFDYDHMNEEVLCKGLAFTNGRLTLPSGMRYRLLVLPDHAVLSPAALAKVHDLVRAGATVVGPKPRRVMTLSGIPESKEQFSRRADELWGDAKTERGENRFGRGRVIWGMTARQVLLRDGVLPDCEFQGAGDRPLDYIHRQFGSTDIYFVANLTEQAVSARGIFRVDRKQPELWDPLTGQMRQATAFRQSNGRTVVPLELTPYGSLFLVFRKAIPPDAAGTAKRNFPSYTTLSQVKGPWTVRFDPKWGGPASVVFDRLVDWSKHPDAGIRYYSGTATYAKTLRLPETLLRSVDGLALDLGDLSHLAEVRLNGKSLGILWCKPFRVEITRAVRPGDNLLEIEVVNNWTNRLVGDAALPPEQRRTRTNITKITKDTPLATSGLLGPVRLMRICAGELERRD